MSKIPEPTIERLVLYSRPLETLLRTGTLVISSGKLARLCGVNAAQVRKDLAYFGEFGVRGVGYDVRDLLHHITSILGSNRQWRLCIVGCGNLGSALLQNENFKSRGYFFVAAFDLDSRRTGKELPGGLTVEAAEQIQDAVKERAIEVGVITTTRDRAQRAANLLMQAGIRAVLNFASTHIRAPECCLIENVDFTVKLENLAYHLSKTG